jgi:predicted MFS family arabinose efflux permease
VSTAGGAESTSGAEPAGGAPPAAGDDSAGVFQTLRDTPASARFLLVGVLINRLSGFLQAFLVLYLVHLGYGPAAAGLGLGAYGVGAVLGILLGGGLSDRLGPRRTIIGTTAIAALLIVSVPAMTSLPAISVAVALAGALSQAYRPASAAMLSDLIPATRQVMVFAMYRLGINLGVVAGPLLAVLLIHYSWNLLFLVEGLAALGYALIGLFLLPADPPSAGRTGPGAVARVGYAVVLRDGRYLLFLAAMLVNALVYVQYVAVLPLAVTAAGLPMIVYSALLSLNGALVVGFELLVTTRVQKWPPRLAVGLGFLLLGGGLTLYAVPAGLAVFVLGTVIWTMGEVVGGPTMFAYPALAAPAAAKGRYLGAAHAMFGVGGALGPVLGVALWSRAGPALWLACGGGAVLALLAAATGIRDPRPEPARVAGAGDRPTDPPAAAGAARPVPAAESTVQARDSG